jgi:hypothetical protein
MEDQLVLKYRLAWAPKVDSKNSHLQLFSRKRDYRHLFHLFLLLMSNYLHHYLGHH